MRFSAITFGKTTWTFERVYVVGVLNVTPDSFSDGGRFAGADDALAAGLRMVELGADAIDVGGESTRPQGARPVSVEEEMARVVPVVRALAARVEVPISIDTTKAAVAAAAIEAGAEIVNDISGGGFEPELVRVVAREGAAYVLGHARGRTLAEVHAAEVGPAGFDEVARELGQRLVALPADVRARTIVDPGLGFGKGTPENLELLRRAGELAAGLSRPVMVGPSRKRFLGELTGRPVEDRDDATVGACLAAVAAGADLLRVHDVKRVRDALAVWERVHPRRGAA